MKTCELSLIKYLLFGFNLIFAVRGKQNSICNSFRILIFKQFYQRISTFYGTSSSGTTCGSNSGRLHCILSGFAWLLWSYSGIISYAHGNLGQLLTSFAVCLLIIFIIELAVGIAAAVYQNEVHEELKNIMRKSLNAYESSDSDRIAWDNLQQKLKCCGVDNATDWTRKRPQSCCHGVREGAAEPDALHCTNARPGDDILYSSGCFEKIEMKTKDASKVLIGVGIGIAFIEVILLNSTRLFVVRIYPIKIC
ncbi:hypothetical protein HUJ04_009926 [Dendroctonus ponderosae]|nr:hypothetical protein HUJ04_009926 [Dendroctonus ponderosae]